MGVVVVVAEPFALVFALAGAAVGVACEFFRGGFAAVVFGGVGCGALALFCGCHDGTVDDFIIAMRISVYEIGHLVASC